MELAIITVTAELLFFLKTILFLLQHTYYFNSHPNTAMCGQDEFWNTVFVHLEDATFS